MSKRKELGENLGSDPDTVIKFMSIITKSVKKHGHEKIIQTLKKIPIDAQDKKIHDQIIEICAKNCGLKNPQEIFTESRTPQIVLSRKCLVIVLRKVFCMSPDEISKIVKQSRQNCYIIIRHYDKLDLKIKFEREYKELVERVICKVHDFLSKMEDEQ